MTVSFLGIKILSLPVVKTQIQNEAIMIVQGSPGRGIDRKLISQNTTIRIPDSMHSFENEVRICRSYIEKKVKYITFGRHTLKYLLSTCNSAVPFVCSMMCLLLKNHVQVPADTACTK